MGEGLRAGRQRYYTDEHIETLLRRALTTKINASNILFLITWFKGSIDIEKIHPLESGFLRLKFRRDRRPERPREPVWVFYPRYLSEIAVKTTKWITLYFRLRRLYLKGKHDPKRFEYTDVAMSAWDESDGDHELFGSEAAKAFVQRQRHLKNVRDRATGALPVAGG